MQAPLTQSITKQSKEFDDPVVRYEAWKVAAYDVSDMVRNKAGDEARMVAQISVYSKETGTVSSVRDDQFWWYDENESRWYLGSPFPDFDATTR